MREQNTKTIFSIYVLLMLMNSQIIFAVPATYPQIKGSVFADGIEIPDGTPVWAMVNVNDRNVSRGYLLYQPQNITHWYYNTSRSVTSRYWLEIFINKSTDDPQFGAMTGDNLSFYINGILFNNATVASTGAAADLEVNINTDEGTVRTWNVSLSDSVAPSAPSSLSATEASAGQVNLTWTNASDNLWVNLSYLAYWSYSSGLNCSTGTLVGSGYNITNITHSTTANGSTVYYVVCANDTSGNMGPASNQANVTVSVLAPAQVTNVSASSSNTTVNLTWNAVSTNNDSSAITDLAGYYIYIWNSSTSWREAVSNTTTEWGNTSLENDVQYSMNVTAYNIYGYESVHSSTVNATPSEAPTISSNHVTQSILGASDNVTITISSSAGLSFLNVTVLNSTGAHVSNDTNSSGIVSPHSYVITPSTWLEGDWHTVVASVNDTSNVWTYANYTYVYDNTSPTISAIVINDSYLNNDSYVFVNITAADNVRVANVTADGTALANTSASEWSGAVQIQNSGNISVVVTDYVGKSVTNQTTLYTLDNTVPVIYYASASDTIIQNGTNVTINANVTEANISAVWANGVSLVNGTNLSQSNTAWSGSVSITSTTLNITALDRAGNYGYNTSVSFTIDDTSPVISSVTLSDNLTRNDTNVTVTVNITDAHSYVVNVTAEGILLTNTSANIWTGNITLSSAGDNVTNILAFDAAGNNATDSSVTWAVDYTAPVLTITSPVNQTNTSNSYVSLTWSAVEANVASNGTWVYGTNNSINGSINSSTGTVNVTGLSEGLNQNITLVMYDQVGYSDTETVYFGIDLTDPVINITNPANGTNYTNSTVNLRWNITETNFVNATWTYKLNTTSAAKNGNVNISVDDGLNQNISITTYDISGRSATEYVTFSVDTTAPIINITSPTNNTNTSAHSITLAWNITEINFLSANYTYNGSTVSITQHNQTTVAVSEGLGQNITIQAADLVGGASSEYVIFNSDWTAPNTTANYSSQTWVGSAVNVSLNATDTGGVGVDATYYCYNTSANCTPVTSGNSIDLSTTGAWMFRYYSRDLAGNNESYKSGYAYVDLTAPNTTSNYVTGTWVNSDFNITLTATDAHSGPNITRYKIGAGAWQNTTFNSSSANTTTVLINTTGNITVVYNTTDNVGNQETTKTIYALLDKVRPNSTMNALSAYSSTRTVQVTFNTSDDNSGINTVKLYYDNGTGNYTYYANSSTGYQNDTYGYMSFTATADGNWSFYTRAVDNAGNVENSTIAYVSTIIDTTAPVLNVSYPTNGTTINVNYTYVNWSVVESNLANITYAYDQNATRLGNASNYTYIANMTFGTHHVWVKATDSAGNYDLENVSFRVNVTMDMNQTLYELASYNSEVLVFEAYNANNRSINYTNETNVSLDGITLDLSFSINLTNNTNSTTNAIVGIEDFSAIAATWSEHFVASGSNSNLETSIETTGVDTQYILTVTNMSAFISNTSEYYVNVTVNITGLNFTYVQYCSGNTVDTCSYISNCTNNTFTNVSQLQCYTINGNWMSIYADSFSSVAISLDNIVATANVTSPVSTSNYTVGSDINLTFTINEYVNGSYTINSSNTTTVISDYVLSHNGQLNGTLNATQLGGYGIFENGQHKVTVTLYDNMSNTDTFNITFNVSDYTAPTITALNVTGTSSSSSSGTATIHVYTDEYTYCWYNQSDTTLNASSSNLSAYSQTDDGLSKHHTISHSYSSSGTVPGYYVTCADVLDHNMTYANFSGNFSVSVTTSTGSPGGGGGSSSSSPTTPTLPTSPSNWGEQATLNWAVINLGESASRSLDNDVIAVSSVQISAAKIITHGSLKLVQLTSSPGVQDVLTHKVYQYLTLLTKNISSDKVAETSIEFRVSKFWINNNRPALDSIKLFRYSSGWIELPTQKVREDDSYVYYTAVSPGFSYFAIAAKEILPEEPDAACPESCDDGNSCTADRCSEETGYVCVHDSIPNCCGNSICEQGESWADCPADCEKACPATCDDDNPCTEDTCSEETGFECSFKVLEPCCGNDVCEEGEDWLNCPAECEEPSKFPWGWLIAIFAILGAAGYIYYKYKWKPEYAKKSGEHKHHETSKK